MAHHDEKDKEKQKQEEMDKRSAQGKDYGDIPGNQTPNTPNKMESKEE